MPGSRGGAITWRLWIFQHRGIVPVPFVVGLALSNHPAYAFASARDVLFDALGFAVIATGLGLRAWAIGHAGSHTRSYKLRAPRLVTSGPYAHVRNPVYLANFLIALGVVMMAKSWMALGLLLVVFLAVYGAIVSLEEKFLADAFGPRYEEYRRRIPRWLPRLTGAAGEAPAGFSWRAVRKEYLAVLSAALMAGAVEFGEYLHPLVVG